MSRKKVNKLIDSRHLKVLAVKKADLKNALVMIGLEENTRANKMALRQICEQFDKIESDAAYFPVTKEMNVQIYDRAEFKNRDIVVTINHNQNVSSKQIEDEVSRAFSDAKSITYVHGDIKVERK